MDEDDVVEKGRRSSREWIDRAQQCIAAGKNVEAKRMLSNAQKELRALKSEVVAEEREARAQFTDARLQANQTGQTLALFVNSKNRGRLARARASQKRSIAQQQQDAMEDYRITKAALDRRIMELDRMKLDVDLGRFDPSTEDVPDPSPFAQPPAPNAAWFADPTGRFQMRYWDGTRWTSDVVSAAGDQGTDPI